MSPGMGSPSERIPPMNDVSKSACVPKEMNNETK